MPRMTGSRFFAEAMQRYGVTHVFFVPTILLPALAEMTVPCALQGAAIQCHFDFLYSRQPSLSAGEHQP
jgi:hypothetical protein